MLKWMILEHIHIHWAIAQAAAKQDGAGATCVREPDPT
jgi:hypothetical protein